MSGDSSLEVGFVEFIKRYKEWIVAITGVISAIFGLSKIVETARGNITWSVLSGAGLVWLLFFWVYNRKSEREIWEGLDQQPKKEDVSSYPNERKWALIGMVALPILTIFSFAVANYIERRPSDKTIILIANFDGDDRKHAITQTVINRLKRAMSEFPEVGIMPLGDVIKEGTELEAISEVGAKHKASIVVWGFYDETLNGTVHIDQARRTTSLSLRQNEMDFNVTLAEGRGVSVQELLSGDMSLATLLVIGVARYDLRDYDGAIGRFTKALEQRYSTQTEIEASDIKFFLGKSLYGKGKYNEAVGMFREVSLLRPDDMRVVSWLGLSLHQAGQYVEAEQLYKRALTIHEKALGQDHLATAQTLNNLALLYDSQGKYADAEPLYKRALSIYEKALGKDHPYTATILDNLGGSMNRRESTPRPNFSTSALSLSVRRRWVKSSGNHHQPQQHRGTLRVAGEVRRGRTAPETRSRHH
jgi:tetratricopeptide (TPR) repeat protein